MSEFIPVNEPLLGGNEKKYLSDCIDTGWISSEGAYVKQFEEEYATRMGRKFGIAVSNGTAAIDISVEALGITHGDEVILPTFTIISCVLQIVRSGATPILVDCDPYTWNMKPDDIEKKITPRTKAIMIVHIYGLPVDMDPILELCKKHKLKLIEDSAEMIGQTYKERPCGSFGDMSTFSFYANKNITTGEGGMILTDNEILAEECRELRNLCFKTGKRFIHERLGWNYRMTNIQAAIGLAQLEQLEQFIEKKRWIGRRYNELLSDVPHLQLPLHSTSYAQNIYWVYGIVLDETIAFDAQEAINRLAIEGIGCRPFFYPLHQQPVLQDLGLFKGEHYASSEHLYKRGLYLPSGLALTENQITRVSRVVKMIMSS